MAAVQEAVLAARTPISAEELQSLVRELVTAHKQGAFEAMRKEAARVIRVLDRSLMARIGISVGAAYVLGGLSVLGAMWFFQQGPLSDDARASAAWHTLVQNNPDPRQSLSAAHILVEPNTGHRYYSGVSLWLDSPAAPH